MKAYCFASGHIEFGSVAPAGAITFATGPERELRRLIEPTARHGYSTRVVDGRATKIPGSDTLLVPGVPEAPTQRAAGRALRRWCDWISKHAPDGVEVL